MGRSSGTVGHRYREDLRRNADNGWSLHGLETSLARQGKTAESAAARERFAKAWARADAAPTITVLAGSGSPPKMASSDRRGAVR